MLESLSYGSTPRVEAEILGCFSDHEMSAAEPNAIQEAVRRPEFSGEIGEVVEAFPIDAPRAFIIGLGKRDELTPDHFRRACAAGLRRAFAAKLEQVQARFTGLDDAAVMGRAFGDAAGSLAWSFQEFRSDESRKDLTSVTLSAADEAFGEGMEIGIGIGKAAGHCRDWVMTPPAVATPEFMAQRARDLADEFSTLTTEVLGVDQLHEENLNGLLTVGRGSRHEPRLIRVAYQPEGGPAEKPIVLLGKTITYDTGGLSIKGKKGMPGMKVDKAGGCAVLAAMRAIAETVKPAFPVVGLLVAAENAISEESYLPDDIITFRNGVTVEVTNTDAEGRLVLADGLCWACDKEDPAAIVDFATLTGGVITALGNEMAGVFTKSDALLNDLEEAAEVSGERVWRLPLDDAFRKMMKSPVADIVNSNLSGKAHSVQGAVFLSYFVKDDVPWAHVDIAGMARTDVDDGLLRPGPTGYGVRLMCDLLRGDLSVHPQRW